MNFATLTTYEQNLLLATDSGEQARKALETAGGSGFQIGIVSDTCPLLSGLSLAENLALWNMYHQNFSLRQAMKRLMPAIRAAGLEHRLDMGIEDLTRKEIVQAYFLRCLAANNSIVLVDNPRPRDLEVITELNCIQTLCRRLWVLCRRQDAERYAPLGFLMIPITEGE